MNGITRKNIKVSILNGQINMKKSEFIHDQIIARSDFSNNNS